MNAADIKKQEDQPKPFRPLIAIPTGGDVHGQLVGWLVNQRVPVAIGTGSPVDHNRNSMVQAFLDTEFTHLMFIDSDVVPPPDVIPRLKASGAPVATGLYPLYLGGRIVIDVNFPQAVVEDHTMWPSPWPVGGVRECTRAGMGCCLIERQVFEQLEDPWFKFVLHGGGKRTGEDVYFFQSAAKAGFKVVCDTSVRCSHWHAGLDLKVIADMWAERKSVSSSLVPVMEI